MTASLPKIKVVPNNVEVESQKSIKYKKIKLYSNLSTEDISKRFKSVKS
jgi:hypothetical protein